MEITTTSPTIYEFGKSVTLQWNITWYEEKGIHNLHSTRIDLYLHKNGTKILVGTHTGLEKNFTALSNDEAEIQINTDKFFITITIIIHKLKYEDFYRFSVEAFSQNKDLEIIDEKNETITVTDIKGYLKFVFRIFRKLYTRLGSHFQYSLLGV